MSLLDKLTYLKRSGLAFVLIPFFFACDDPNELGLEVDRETTNVVLDFVELDLPISTIYIDSLRTENQDNILFGSFEDSITGKATAIGYTNYNQDINSANEIPEESNEFLSAKLILKISNVKTESFITDFDLTIATALDTLFKSAVYLSNRSTPIDPQPIGQLNFDFNPETDSILNVPLESDFGNFLFKRLINTNIDSVYEDSLLLSLYHYDPLVFISSENSRGLFSIDLSDDTTGIYIHSMSESNDSSLYKFDMISGSSTDAHYTQIIRDRSGSKVVDLSDDYSELTDDSSRSYLNPIHGIFPKIDASPIHEFIASNENIIINRSEISLNYAGWDADYINPVSFVSFFFIKENGKINGAGSGGTGIIRNAILTESAYLSGGTDLSALVLFDNEEELSYSGNTTFFTQRLVDYLRDEDPFLADEIVILTQRTLDLGQTSFLNSTAKIRIYYSSVKN